ncbi:MAG: caspase family protein [Chloroflexi bacterium]|nr:caspase family protein [Chloroflexota bacterium]
MNKKALCVGINDYPYDGNDLKGCVNDANDWAQVLITRYDFPSSDVRLLTDAQATKASIISALKGLLAGAQAGDVLVFTNSSHGTYVTEKGGDEPNYDEAICPYDIDASLIVDDELRELFTGLPKGVRLTVISDSCFSGTVTRARVGEILPGLQTPDDRRVRFLNPALRGGKVLNNPWKAKPRGPILYPQSAMKEVLLSGCTDSEYSYDARIGGKYHGAMTCFALQAIKAANYKLTYTQLSKGLNGLIKAAGYPQHPQLEGAAHNKGRQIFT